MAEGYLVSKKYHEISVLASETARQVSKKREGMDKIPDYRRKAV
ncbi:hypothetical protein IMSAGC018_00282 [Lachnospiraceae bacterium]|nr:hypothetical protein IMSAGC018_00282 [Lachnospiraceae bacterium]